MAKHLSKAAEPRTSGFPSPLLRELTVQQSPKRLLARYFLSAVEQVWSKGVTLEFGSAHSLKATNTANRESWSPLVPMYDVACNDLNAENLIVVLGRDQGGKVITANAVRLYDWRSTNFIAEATSLRLMYSDQNLRRPGEECIITSPRSSEIVGQSAFSGAAWVHSDHRHLGLGAILPVLIKVLSVATWKLDNVFGMMSEGVFRRGFAERFGFENSEWAADWKNSVHGNVRFAVLWASPEYIVDLAKSHLAGGPSEIDGVVRPRNAK